MAEIFIDFGNFYKLLHLLNSNVINPVNNNFLGRSYLASVYIFPKCEFCYGGFLFCFAKFVGRKENTRATSFS